MGSVAVTSAMLAYMKWRYEYPLKAGLCSCLCPCKGKYYVVCASFWEVAGEYWAGIVTVRSVKMLGEEGSMLESSVLDRNGIIPQL